MVPTKTTPAQQRQGDKSNVRHDVLSLSQCLRTTVIGIVFWYLAALAVRYGTALGWFSGTAILVTFALGGPIGWITVQFVKWAAALQPAQIVPGIALGTAAATLCDGIALIWTPALYGPSPEKILPGAAWILWGVGALLASAYMEVYRHKG